MYALNNALFSKVGNPCSQVVYIWNELKLPGNTILQSTWACATLKWCWLCRPSSKSSMQLVSLLSFAFAYTQTYLCTQTASVCCLLRNLAQQLSLLSPRVCAKRNKDFWRLKFSVWFFKIIYFWPQYCSSFTSFNYIKWWMTILYQMPWKA